MNTYNAPGSGDRFRDKQHSRINIHVSTKFIKLLLGASYEIRNWIQSSQLSGEKGIFSALKFTEIQKSKQTFKTGGKSNGNSHGGDGDGSTGRAVGSSAKTLLNE